MTIRRICTINGEAYALTGHCPACGDPMWTTIDPPTQQAGCTASKCLQDVTDTSTPAPAPAPRPNPIIMREDEDEDIDLEADPE